MLVNEILNYSRGKVVVIKTVSGEEIIGQVVKLKNGVVELTNQTGRKLFVVVNYIIAVIV